MNVWFCSDLHLGHENIPKFRECVTSVADNTSLILSAWEKQVTKRDTVYVLGDVAFDVESLGLLKTMAGKKILIKGNHDILPIVSYLEVFDDTFGLYRYKNYVMSHAPIHPGTLRGKVNLHGHVHQRTLMNEYGENPNYMNCCVENLMALFNSPLISLSQLRHYLENRTWDL